MKTRWIGCAPFLLALGCSGDPDGNPGAGGAVTNGSGGAAMSGGSSAGGSAQGGSAQGGTATTQGGATNPPGVGGQVVMSSGGANGSGAPGAGGAAGNPASGGSAQGGGSSAGKGGSGGASTGGSSGAGGSSGGTGSGSGGMGSTAMDFFAANCALCHGARGEGVSGKGPEVQHPVRDFATWVIRNGRQNNPGFPSSAMAAFTTAQLPEATLTAIFDWLSTPALPKPTTGAALYKDYCSNCHGPGGTGGTAGHNAKGESMSKALQMVRGGHGLGSFSSRTSYMPKWSATELTDAEVGLIVSYLDSL